MLNLRKGSQNDIESLIESMFRLIDYMNANPAFKRKIFESFNQEDLNKIVKNLYENNILLRKTSCIFLCTILQNDSNCEQFIRIMDLLPVNSKIVLNSIPEKMSKYLTVELLQKLNSVQPMDHTLCWYYTQQMAKEQITNLAYFVQPIKEIKKAVNEFIDPIDCLIGITYIKQSYKQTAELKSRSFSPISQPKSNISYQDQRIDTETEKKPSYQKNIYDILKHRMSDNQRVVKSPIMKKNSQDWRSIDQKQNNIRQKK